MNRSRNRNRRMMASYQVSVRARGSHLLYPNVEFFISRTHLCFLLIIRSLTAAAIKPNIGLNQYTFSQRARGLSGRRRKLRGCKFLSREYLCLDPKFGCLIPRLYWLPSLTFPNRRTQSMKAVSLFVSNEHTNVHLVQTQYCCTNSTISFIYQYMRKTK